MSTHKKIKPQSGQKELAKKVQGAITDSLAFLRPGLSEKKWIRNIKKACKVLLEDYKQPKDGKPAGKTKKVSTKKIVPVELTETNAPAIKTPEDLTGKRVPAEEKPLPTNAKASVKKAAPLKKVASPNNSSKPSKAVKQVGNKAAKKTIKKALKK